MGASPANEAVVAASGTFRMILCSRSCALIDDVVAYQLAGRQSVMVPGAIDEAMIQRLKTMPRPIVDVLWTGPTAVPLLIFWGDPIFDLINMPKRASADDRSKDVRQELYQWRLIIRNKKNNLHTYS